MDYEITYADQSVEVIPDLGSIADARIKATELYDMPIIRIIAIGEGEDDSEGDADDGTDGLDCGEESSEESENPMEPFDDEDDEEGN